MPITRRLTALMAALLAAALLTAALLATPLVATGAAAPARAVRGGVSSAGAAGSQHLSESRIRAIALAAARRDGDARPTLIQHAEGPTQQADRLAGVTTTGVPAGGPGADAYLVALRGSFTHRIIENPPGIPMGPGPVILPEPVMTLVIDASTGRVTATELSERYPSLARLGPVLTDLRDHVSGPQPETSR